MRRREFIGLSGTAALSIPRSGSAQTRTSLPLIGLLLPLKSDAPFAKDRITALRKGLQEAGFIEGTNYSLAVRFAEGNPVRYPELVKELGALNARVIVLTGSLIGMSPRTRSIARAAGSFWGQPAILAPRPVAEGISR